MAKQSYTENDWQGNVRTALSESRALTAPGSIKLKQTKDKVFAQIATSETGLKALFISFSELMNTETAKMLEAGDHIKHDDEAEARGFKMIQ